MKDILKTVLVLSIIALIAGGLLGLINHFTQIDQEAALAGKIEKTGIYTGSDPLVKLALGGDGVSQGYINGELKNVFQGGEQYIIHCCGEGGYGGNIELLVNIENNLIKKIAIYAAEETPGLGTKAYTDSYLGQFYNKDLIEIQKFALTKNINPQTKEIKAVTGASKSSGAVVNAVNVAITWYLNHTGQNVDVIELISETEIYDGATALESLNYNIDEFNEDISYGELKGVFSGENCNIIYASGNGGYNGSIEILVNISDSQITKIVVFNSSETPNRTPSALVEAYYSQFYSVDLGTINKFVSVNHSTLDSQIEAVTGASKSSTAMVNAVNVAVSWYLENAEEVEQ